MPDDFSAQLASHQRLRLRMQGMLLVLVPLTILLLGGMVVLAWTLRTPLPPDPEWDAMRADHRAQMRAMQEGR
jgi:hypothetical protein